MQKIEAGLPRAQALSDRQRELLGTSIPSLADNQDAALANELQTLTTRCIDALAEAYKRELDAWESFRDSGAARRAFGSIGNILANDPATLWRANYKELVNGPARTAISGVTQQWYVKVGRSQELAAAKPGAVLLLVLAVAVVGLCAIAYLASR